MKNDLKVFFTYTACKENLSVLGDLTEGRRDPSGH